MGVSVPTNPLSPAVSQDCRDDVGGAQQAGMRGILVRTGKYSMDWSFQETLVASVISACAQK